MFAMSSTNHIDSLSNGALYGEIVDYCQNGSAIVELEHLRTNRNHCCHDSHKAFFGLQ
jgi:hypothetical protein